MFRFHQAHVVDERGESFGQRGSNPGLPVLGDDPGSLPSGSEVSSSAKSKAPPTPFSAFAQCRDLDSDDSSSSESLRVLRPKRRRHVSARSRISSESKKILAKWIRKYNNDQRDGHDVAATNRSFHSWRPLGR